MKRIVLFAAFLAFAFSAKAQLADGSVAPDFTATDINGVEHNLYDLLNEGKTVILDISATWCPPCWSYHNSGALDQLYECYGEEGSDNVVVFMVEGDPGTTFGDLEGTGSNTLGDWITGTPYPIIESPDIADSYEITYWPTIYRICPGDKTVYELGQAGTQAAKDAVLNTDCTPAVRAKDAALTCSSSSGEVCPGNVSLAVGLFNSGSEMLTSATVRAMVNGEVVAEEAWTGSLGLYEETDVMLPGVDVTQETDVTFEVEFADDEHMENNDSHAHVEVAPGIETEEGTMETITIELETDNYGNETYWVVMDDAGTMIAEGGNAGVGLTNTGVGAGNPPSDPGAYGNNEVVSVEVDVPADGCYNVIFTDYWGDGMCCTYGDGYYRVLNSLGEAIIEGGQFGARSDNPFFKSTLVSNEEIIVANSFEVFPNPTAGNTTVQFGLINAARVTVEVTNALGQVVYADNMGNLPAGQHMHIVNMDAFQAGVYLVNLKTDLGQTTTKLVKQ